MGPEDGQSMLEDKILLSLPKLHSDGSNWTTYQERVINTLTSKGLKRHVLGTARKPVGLVEMDGNHYKPSQHLLNDEAFKSFKTAIETGILKPLSEEEIEKHEDTVDLYDQNQATVRDVIYRTIDKSTFLQVKGEKTANLVWQKLASIHTSGSGMREAELLNKLQTMRYVDGTDMREHLTNMVETRERLAEMNVELSETSFVIYIRTSLSLVPIFRPLFIALNAATSRTGTPITSQELMNHLIDEANSKSAEDNMNKSSNAAMLIQNKDKSEQRKKRSDKHCTVCNGNDHVKESCWQKGGDKEGQAPDWWKEKQKRKAKKTTEPSANAIKKDEDETENITSNDNYAFVTSTQSLALTLDTALVTASTPEIIIDCGATAHLSSDRESLINYRQIVAEPIKAADGRKFNAFGVGDMKIYLPMGRNERPTLITLKNVYYAPTLAFTLVSVSRMARAGFSLTIDGNSCIVRSPKPKSKIRLGTSALVGNPDPYPRVFWAPNVTPGSVKIFSHGSPGAASQKPMGQRVPTGITNDRSSWVLTGIPMGTHIEK
jgi:gag-polypeptide of LTR copia-type